MKRVKGDLIQLALANEFDVIVHGCNCFCAMSQGIARQIRKTFPKAWDADRETASGDRSKLGRYSLARIHVNGLDLVVVNGYTQFRFDGTGVLADYQAIETLFGALKADFSGKRFGYPRIGAGLAGGDWDTIRRIIDRAMDGEDHTVVEFQRQAP